MGILSFFKAVSDALSEAPGYVNDPEPITIDVVPIEKFIYGKIPPCDGLFPHEILVLYYAPTYLFDSADNSFQQFWWYKYGIRDVSAILDKLKTEGYITRCSLNDAVNAATTTTLKDVLKENSLKVSGKKKDLVERVLREISEEQLSIYFPNSTYACTERGNEILKKYEWIPFVHLNHMEDLDIFNSTDMMLANPTMNYRDALWAYLNKRFLLHSQNGDYGLARNCLLTMSDFLGKEGKKQEQFDFLCGVLFYDLSGLHNGEIFLELLYELNFPYRKGSNKLNSCLLDRASKLAKILGWDKETIKNELSIEYSKRSLPIRLFTNEECVEITMAEMEGDKEKVIEIYEIAGERFKKKYLKPNTLK